MVDEGKKIYFNQLSGVGSTQKQAEIHNSFHLPIAELSSQEKKQSRNLGLKTNVNKQVNTGKGRDPSVSNVDTLVLV